MKFYVVLVLAACCSLAFSMPHSGQDTVSQEQLKEKTHTTELQSEQKNFQQLKDTKTQNVVETGQNLATSVGSQAGVGSKQGGGGGLLSTVGHVVYGTVGHVVGSALDTVGKTVDSATGLVGGLVSNITAMPAGLLGKTAGNVVGGTAGNVVGGTTGNVAGETAGNLGGGTAGNLVGSGSSGLTQAGSSKSDVC